MEDYFSSVNQLIITSNNKKYWDTPCDGTAYPPNICGGLYEKKHFTKKKVCRPGFNCRRVGFYCSKLN